MLLLPAVYAIGSLVRNPIVVVVDGDSHLETLDSNELTGTSPVAFEYGCAASAKVKVFRSTAFAMLWSPPRKFCWHDLNLRRAIAKTLL